MLRFIHGADFHLDAPFAALPPARAAERRGEQRALLDRLADLVEERGADLVLLSGDLLDDGTSVYAETLTALTRALGRMKVPVFIAPGNHDFWSARSPYAGGAWPENVHIFHAETPEAVPLPDLGCTVYGAAFLSANPDHSPLQGFRAPLDGGVHIMALHGDVGGSGYGPIDPVDIAGSGLTYLALGHIHAGSGLMRAGETYWAYPGCPEGRGFDELGDKGVLYGTVEDGTVSTQFVPLAGRRYHIETVDVTDLGPEAALQAFLPQTPSPDLCRILLTGECGAFDLEALETMAAPCFYSVSLRDQTRIHRDLWGRAGEDTLTGLFLRQLRQRLDAAESDADRALIEHAARFGLAALENAEDPFG